ncbi:hypothetical protein CR513_20522, partial [Mucuna pruriens]
MVRLCVIKQARLEVICILLSFATHHNMELHKMDVKCSLSFATHHNMKLHKMDVKCSFLNDIINEEVFVKQPPSF